MFTSINMASVSHLTNMMISMMFLHSYEAHVSKLQMAWIFILSDLRFVKTMNLFIAYGNVRVLIETIVV